MSVVIQLLLLRPVMSSSPLGYAEYKLDLHQVIKKNGCGEDLANLVHEERLN